jgi:tetratricopeptide (TPR) repeat protein
LVCKTDVYIRSSLLKKKLIKWKLIMNKAIFNNVLSHKLKCRKKLSGIILTMLLAFFSVHSPTALSEVDNSNNHDQGDISAVKDNEIVKNKRVRRAQTMRPKIFKKLDKVRELTDSGKYSEAELTLKSIANIKRNSYEVAMTWNMHAYLYFNQENYSAAATAYENVIAGKRVPESLLQTTLYSLAKLYLMQQDYNSALVTLNKWFNVVENPGAEAYVIRAQLHYQIEQFKHALPDIKQAISMSLNNGKKPRENWLLIERAVYFQNKDYVSMARCLKDLIAFYPESSSISQYWIQLSAIYNELGKPETELAILEAAYDQGLLLKEAQKVSLAQAMLGKDIPYKSAQILLQGLKDNSITENAKNLSLLGDALMLAKEYEQAIVIMAKAADLSDLSKDYYKLAQIHTERQEWDDALINVDRAIEKNDPDSNRDIKVNEARILKGLVLFNMNHLLLAKAEFERASETVETQKMAEQWLKYIASEVKRIAFIADTE